MLNEYGRVSGVFDKVLVLWLDAYSSRFLSFPEAKFVKGFSEQNTFALIRPTFAYKGIGYSIFTGASINKHRVWMEHSFAKNHHSVSLKQAIRLSEIIPNDYLQKAARFALYKGWRAYYGTPHLIPVKYLDYFAQVKPKPIPTLFDTLRTNKIGYCYCEPKTSFGEASLFRRLRSLVSRHDLVYAKFNSLDRLGHMFGPLSKEVRNRIKWLDIMLKDSLTQISRDNKRTLILIFSDHGMTPVGNIIDIESKLEKVDLEVGKDYVAYEGSTYWAFYFLKRNVKEIIEDKLANVAAGKMITPEAVEDRWGVEPNVSKKFGDAFYVLKEGTVAFPDFYRRQIPPNGMHGYFDAEWDAPVIVLSGQKGKQEKNSFVEFHDITPTIYKALGLSIPSWCDGTPLQFQ